jgi:hypothetical protein
MRPAHALLMIASAGIAVLHAEIGTGEPWET